MSPTDDPEALRRKLASVRRLRDAGSTPGERRAARAAEARLQARLSAQRDAPSPAPLQDAPGVSLPGTALLLGWLDDWACGAADRAAVRLRAAFYVDKLVLPELPQSDPRSLRVEALLELSARGPGAIGKKDQNALRDFILGEADPEAAWAAWWRWRAGQRPRRLG